MGSLVKEDPRLFEEITVKVTRVVSERIGSQWKSLVRRLGVEDHIIENLEQDAITFGWDSTERSYQGLRKWQARSKKLPTLKDLLCVLTELDEGLARQVRTEVGIKDMEDQVGRSQAVICRHDIESKPVSCLGREKEIEILKKLCAPPSPERLMVLTGLPGMGKSLVIHTVNQAIETAYPDYPVYRPKLPCTANTVEKVYLLILECFDPNCQAQKKSVINKTMKKLEAMKRPFLLILDMSHIQPCCQFWEELMTNFSGLLSPNRPYLKLLVSACYLPKFPQIFLPERKEVALHELDQDKSQKVLQALTTGLDDNSAAVICSYCGGTPSVLRCVAEYISKEPREVSTMVHDCESICCHSSVLNSIIRECMASKYFKTLFGQMNKPTKQVLVKLAVVPGSFDEDLVKDLVTKLEFDALNTLTRRYFVLEQKHGSYHLHRIFKEFLECSVLQDNVLLKALYSTAMSKYIRIFTSLLRTLNSIFMNSSLPKTSSFVESLIDSTGGYMKCVCSSGETDTCECVYESSPCRCNKANVAFDLFKRYKLQIMYCLTRALESGENEALEAIDCTSETISFLNKIFPFDKLHSLLEMMFVYARDRNYKLRVASLLVSISFIRMSNLGVDVDKKSIFKMLSKAREILEAKRNLLKTADELEVLAHCYSKLGRLTGTYLKKYQEGKQIIHMALEIRKSEINGNGNRVLEAATLVDLANLCRELKEYDYGLYLLKERVLPVYRQYLWIHPFTASTLRYIGNIFSLKGDYQQAEFYYKLALHVQRRLIYFKADKVLLHRDMARNCMNQKDFRLAKVHYEKAIELENCCFQEHTRFPEIHEELAKVEGALGNREGKERKLQEYKNLIGKQRARKRSRQYERNISRLSVGSYEDLNVSIDEIPEPCATTVCEVVSSRLNWIILLICMMIAYCTIMTYFDSDKCLVHSYFKQYYDP